MTIAFLFPGQGSQSVGMLDAYADHPEVQAYLARASEALGQDLGALIATGPAEQLALTVNTQPAMLAAGYVNLLAWRAAGGPEPAVVAGHSLGEYTALAAAGAIDAALATKLVRIRAQAMQDAVPVGTGGMAVILGLDDDAVRAACAAACTADERVDAANFNGPNQVVIAGHKPAIERACAEAKARGAKRAMALPVSAPFHSPLLEPAGRKLATVLADVTVNPPSIPLLNNVDVAVESDPARIKDALVRQAYGPVRWTELMNKLAEMGVDHVIEFGPGKVLSGLAPRIVKSMRASAVYDPATLQAVLAEVKGAQA